MNARSTETGTPQRWAKYPVIYEINTWVWLSHLRHKYGKQLDLSSVPRQEWDAMAAYGFDAVWLMGVWERSPAGTAIANRNEGLLADFRRALPDFRPEDNVGSPYSIRRYVVDQHLGGPKALAVARNELSQRRLKLILDFVPNHVAPDHPWINEHPDYFVLGNSEDLTNDPTSFLDVGGTISALGRDPYFPAWPDVLQLNAFSPGLRKAVIETAADIAGQCDGVRCDMAMLFLNAIFERTWGTRGGARPESEYWVDVISATKSTHPNFLFIAEAYWDLEWELQQLGFDFCYDKKLYDRLEHGNAESIRLHLSADAAYQDKLLRFIENHDEPRATASFPPEKLRAATVTIATLSGARLFHEGQFEGRKVRPPVFLARRPDEPPDHDLQVFAERLLKAIDRPVFRDGEWSLCERSGWHDNESCQNLVVWSWTGHGERYLVAVNLSDSPLQARVHLPWADVGDATWRLSDELMGATYERDGNEMQAAGLYIELDAWNFHFFELVRLTETST
jgi:hypothetical protein